MDAMDPCAQRLQPHGAVTGGSIDSNPKDEGVGGHGRVIPRRGTVSMTQVPRGLQMHIGVTSGDTGSGV